MYTKIKNVQIILSLLKQHNIRHLVLSAGTRHVPIAHSAENDEFFTCYSVVDERSAGYFALGLSKELGVPVAIACTSSTATCNYTPPIAEAYYQKVPLLILTGDRDPYRLNQLEDQMINQVDMYHNFCNKAVTLPVVKNEYDTWYCQRLVNDALLELRHNGGGPVQINFPIVETIEDIADASVPTLPLYNKISRLEYSSSPDMWMDYVNALKNKKRVLVLCGSGAPLSDGTEALMGTFYEAYNCAIATEPMSNVHCKGAINTYLIAEAGTAALFKQISPDLIIFFGGNFISRLKQLVRNIPGCETWVITEDGKVMDPFQNLTTVFECSVRHFFEYFSAQGKGATNNGELYATLEALKSKIVPPAVSELPERANRFLINDNKFKNLPAPTADELIDKDYLSSMLAISELSARIQKNSLVHLSILNSTRMFPLFPVDDSVRVYSNIGTDGIDGSMSTFFGQASACENECYLVIGDLSFFYDMNSLGIRNIKPNAHILLVNNGGGAEFYFSMGPKLLPNIDLHISASHEQSAKDWVLANRFRYLSARTSEEFLSQIDTFVAPNADAPVVFEIFTDKEFDVRLLKVFRRIIHLDTPIHKLAKQVEELPFVKKNVETPAGQSLKGMIKKGLHKIM